jgi:7-cyano-7-deazaguanine reductase
MNLPRTKKYASLTLLGRTEASLPKSPRQAKIETFANPKPARDYTIRLDCPDFTSLCPVTGQPDFAEITIEYIPDKVCIETKSLKLYLASYRNAHSFNEQVINTILDDLVKACRPRRMKIEGKFASRGGLSLTVVAEHDSSAERARPRAQQAPAGVGRKGNPAARGLRTLLRPGTGALR